MAENDFAWENSIMRLNPYYGNMDHATCLKFHTDIHYNATKMCAKFYKRMCSTCPDISDNFTKQNIIIEL